MWSLRVVRRRIGAGTFVTAVSLGAAYLFFHNRSTNVNETGDNEIRRELEHSEHGGVNSIKRYCNYPSVEESSFSVEELRELGLKLRGLTISTRHGDRAPLSNFASHLKTPFCGLRDSDDTELYNFYEKSLNGESQQEILPESLQKFRKLPPNDVCRLGHLTMIGVVQMYKLGRNLKQVYGEIFPLNDKTTEFYLYTTFYARTYQSGLAFLHGLLNAEIVSELSMMGTENVYFCTENWCRCPKLVKYNADYYTEQHDYYKKNGKHVEVIVNEVNEILKSSASTDPVMCFDHLVGYWCHREPLPRLSDTKGVTNEMLNSLYAFLTLRYNEAQGWHAGSKKAFIEAIPNIVRWQNVLESLKTDPTKSSFQYFSGHDVTLAPILAVLGVFDGNIPPYASNLRVEMIEKVDTKKIYLRFIYNGDDFTKRVQFCNGSLEKFGRYYLCDSDSLTKFVRQFLNEKMQPTNEFRSICSTDERLGF